MSEITERMPTLDLVRGSLERARGNARSVAALTDNPGCTRRRVIDAAAVEAHTLAEKLGHPVTRGQSPFAIATGNQFERRLKTGSGYAQLSTRCAHLLTFLRNRELRTWDAPQANA
jgi:hypothetical protein